MATNVRSGAVQTQPSAALIHKCTREFAKLKSKLEIKLQNDLNSCFESALFANLAVITKTVAIPVHTAFLQARTPFFFKELISESNQIPSRISIPDADPEQLRSLFRKIYTENFVEEEETILIALLRRARRLDKGDKIDNTTQPVTPTVISRTIMEAKPENGNNTDPPHKDIENSSNNNNNIDIDREKYSSDVDHCSGPNEPLEMTVVDSPTSSSLLTSDFNMGLTSDTDSGVVHRESGDETATPKSEDCSDDDKSRSLIRRNTFDLIEMALMNGEDVDIEKLGSPSKINEFEDTLQSRVVWEVGGEAITRGRNLNVCGSDAQTPSVSPINDNEASNLDRNSDFNVKTPQDNDNLDPEEVIYLENPTKDCRQHSIMSEMKHSNSKLFSPDSIISDRSPLLERASGFPQNTIHILPNILTDYIQSESGLQQRRMSSRKSSDSLSPDADSLTVESSFPTHHGTIETVMEENTESSTDENKCNKGKGSYFVFIDMKKIPEDEPPPPPKPPVGKRRRAISFTAGEEPVSDNRNLCVDSCLKDSLSDEERDSRTGVSPKTPTSVYMYIDAASSSSKESSLKRKTQTQCRKTSTQDAVKSKSNKSRHVRALSLGQERINISATPEPQKPKENLRLQEMQLLGKSNGSIPSADQDDDVDTIYSEFSDYAGQDRSSSVVSPEDDDRPPVQAPCSKLGEDLLRMFLEEINTDVVVRVNDKDIKAHKCVLSSRCSYFAAMLSGGWLESSGNVINLHGFSFTAVHFALCHIYSGATAIPKDLDILELASLADMLGLEGLKDVVALTLRAKYCHFFHKPCTTCVTGVMECLPLCANYGLEELYEKAIRWLTRYMSRTWPTKAFASLPSELLNKCYLSAKAEITVDSVLDMVVTCDKLMTTLPHVKWSEPVFGLSSRLLEACTVFMAKNFHAVLTSKNFLALGKGQSWNVNALEDTIMAALNNLTPDSACLSYATLDKLLGDGESNLREDDPEIIENFVELLHKIQRQIERYLIHNANRVVHAPGWSKLSPTTQKRIKDAAVIVFEFGKPTAPPPRLSSLNRRFYRGKNHSPADRSESSTTSSSSGKVAGPRKNLRTNANPVNVNKFNASRPAANVPLAGLSKDGPLQKKTPTENTQKSLSVKRSSSATLNENIKTKGSTQTNRHSDGGLSATSIRKSTSRDRVTTCNSRPKSWPNKDKTQHPIKVQTQNKENTKETRIANSTGSLRTATRNSASSRSTSGSMSRPKSACYCSDSTPESGRPTRSVTTSALRDTKSSASKRVTLTESEDSTKPKPQSVNVKTTRSSTLTGLKKTKDEFKIQSTTINGGRRTAERAGIKASTGNKG